MGMTFWVVVVILFVTTPLALLIAALLVIAMRRRSPDRSTRPRHLVVAAAAGYLLAFVAFPFTPWARTVGENYVGLLSLIDGCGPGRGFQIWWAHRDNLRFGWCTHCDDTNLYPEYRGEYRRHFCPETLQPDWDS